jgi:hypothetical protein
MQIRITRLLDAIGSIPFGVTMMILVLLYGWIGSAGTHPFHEWFVRQTFEKTEMGWFTWWPFKTLVSLLCLAVTIVTIRRIPFRSENAGVWTVHAGLLVLCTGSCIYFGRKIEGDLVLFRREAVARTGQGPPAVLTLRPGEESIVRGASRSYRLRVQQIDPHYTLLSGEDLGKRAFMAQLWIEPLGDDGQRAPFIRQLLAGYPQYTEDVIPGQGRAKKTTGKALVDEQLSIELRYAAADRIQLNDRTALFARREGEEEWTELPMDELPRYRPHVSHTSEIRTAPEEPPLPARELSIRPAWRENPGGIDPLLSFKVTGYLPYASVETDIETGGRTLNPYLDVEFKIEGKSIRQRLLAFHPELRQGRDTPFSLLFEWAGSEPASPEAAAAEAPRVSLLADGNSIRAVWTGIDGSSEAVPLPVTGESVRLNNMEIRVHRFITHPKIVRRPFIIPSRQRDTQSPSLYFYSAIRVEIAGGDWAETVWLPFNLHRHPVRPGIRYQPTSLTLPDGQVIELLFSRETRRLPSPVALEEFALQTYPGSTASNPRPRDFISRIRFYEEGRWSQALEVSSNHPTEHRGWWFFQSTWDPPDPNTGYAGLNYTGLGVGNRHGVRIMLAGGIMAVMGTFFAFYVKPILLRHRTNTTKP